MITTTEIAARPRPSYPASALRGYGLELGPWTRPLVEQMARWGEHGYPYAAFDLAHLRDRARANAVLEWVRDDSRHRHFVATEDGIAVGRVSVNLEDDIGLYLWAVHVPPEHEGRGVCRRMLATLMDWLELQCPQMRFSLTTNTFARRAHQAYSALGFAIADTRWVFDQAVAGGLWTASPAARRIVRGHMRFHDQQWQTRSYLMVREPGAPMHVPVRRR